MRKGPTVLNHPTGFPISGTKVSTSSHSDADLAEGATQRHSVPKGAANGGAVCLQQGVGLGAAKRFRAAGHVGRTSHIKSTLF